METLPSWMELAPTPERLKRDPPAFYHTRAEWEENHGNLDNAAPHPASLDSGLASLWKSEREIPVSKSPVQNFQDFWTKDSWYVATGKQGRDKSSLKPNVKWERENAEYPPLPQFRLQPKGTHDHLPMRTLVSCQTFYLLDRRYTDSQPALTCLPCIQSSLVTQRNQLLQSWPSHLSLCYRYQQAKQTDPAVTWCMFSEP